MRKPQGGSLIALQQFGENPAYMIEAGLEPGMSPMDLSLTAADLSFVLCGLIMMLATLLVWAIHTAERWIVLQRPVNVRSNRERPGT